MADDRHEAPEHTGEPVPRDLPDQQANAGEDPWEVPVESDDDAGEGDDVPDTDEAGTGRQGAAQSGAAQTEDPAPQEPSG